jgi:hypothetical protein
LRSARRLTIQAAYLFLPQRLLDRYAVSVWGSLSPPQTTNKETEISGNSQSWIREIAKVCAIETGASTIKRDVTIDRDRTKTLDSRGKINQQK